MKITIHNVGRGAAVLLELPGKVGEHRSVGVVDCYWGPTGASPLMSKLEELDRAQGISIEFLVLTHMHADHFIGVGQLLDRFAPKIKKFFDPGLNARAVVLAEFPKQLEVDNRARQDINAIEKFKQAFPERVHTLSCPEVTIYRDEVNEIEVRSIAPNGAMLANLERILSSYFRRVRAVRARGNDLDADFARKCLKNYNLNKTSSAVQILYRGKSIILGGDVLKSSWEMVLKSGLVLEADAFLLSHHGSSDAFPAKQWKSIFRANGHTLVSGYGNGQPAGKVVKFLKESGETVWITNRPDARRRKDDLLDYVSEFHYAVPTQTVMEFGDLVLEIDNPLRISGPRLI